VFSGAKSLVSIRECGASLPTCMMLLGAAIAVVVAFAAPADAQPAIRGSGTDRPAAPIYFYSNLGATVPGPAYAPNTAVVRPTGLLIFQDGSFLIEMLRWTRWGSSVAHATGIASSSTCKPNCATAPRINKPAEVTVSQPKPLLGREVYTCYQLTVPSDPASDQSGCLKPSPGGGYMYAAVSSAATGHATGAAMRPCTPTRPIGVDNLQASGVSCAVAMSIPQSQTASRHVISKHKFTWKTTAGWACVAVTFSSPYGEDDLGSIIDCRRGSQEVRWSNNTRIEPRSLSG
jgi:hypothetical protein